MTALTITPATIKRLIGMYAARQANSVGSHLGDSKGGSSGACILTIGVLLTRVPRRFYRGERSILDKWAEARGHESDIEHAAAVARGRDRFDKRIENLDHRRRLIVEHYVGIERDPMFRAALVWAASDLERRLSVVPNREILLWMELLG